MVEKYPSKASSRLSNPEITRKKHPNNTIIKKHPNKASGLLHVEFSRNKYPKQPNEALSILPVEITEKKHPNKASGPLSIEITEMCPKMPINEKYPNHHKGHLSMTVEVVKRGC